MTVEITSIENNKEYEINGKLVFMDQSGNWQCDVELSQIEKTALKSYTQLILNNPRLTKHAKATYRT
ncbi:hypothetical protein [Flavobacterium sp. ov086]|uniref:hypothetical protein n=1 Tax=Flavobacterium sp. ov086 TaxID=1761785 RepID=UPI000B6969FF|nr:hypothetical protein [Flavobacterium sp. ov086]SNR92481.1 hypothetical protein SAMN04487979_13123 [Flavobacterium sp. ov086]